MYKLGIILDLLYYILWLEFDNCWLERCTRLITGPQVRFDFCQRAYICTKIRKEQSNNELLLEQISAGISVGPSENTNWLYLSITYISDAVNHKSRNIFKREGLPVGITHKSTTLRQTLQTKNDKNGPSRKAIYASISGNVLYKITCNKCHLIYIGSTTSDLHDRVHEHLSKPSSSVFKHIAACDINTENPTSVNITGRTI
jgi:hypothetical protein